VPAIERDEDTAAVTTSNDDALDENGCGCEVIDTVCGLNLRSVNAYWKYDSCTLAVADLLLGQKQSAVIRRDFRKVYAAIQ
jgi:hypothetical protein